MSKLGIVVDTGASIPEEIKQEYEVESVPAVAVFGDKSYRDIVDFKSPSELFELIDKSPQFPTTSAPSPADYLEAYRRLSKKVASILCVTISSELSMCFKSATLAKEMAAKELPGVDIEVFDSRTTVGGTGFIALAAARAGAAGKSLAQAVEAAKEVQSKVHMFIIIDTLTYLAKSGRIGKAQAWMGNMLSVKPIVEISTSSGLVEPIARVRTKPKAVNQLLEIVKQMVGTEKPLHMMVQHTIVPQEAEKLKEMVSAQFNCAELHLCEFHPLAALVTGPRNLALGFYSD